MLFIKTRFFIGFCVSLHFEVESQDSYDLILTTQSGINYNATFGLSHEQAIKTINAIQQETKDCLRVCPDKYGKEPIDIDNIVKKIKNP